VWKFDGHITMMFDGAGCRIIHKNSSTSSRISKQVWPAEFASAFYHCKNDPVITSAILYVIHAYKYVWACLELSWMLIRMRRNNINFQEGVTIFRTLGIVPYSAHRNDWLTKAKPQGRLLLLTDLAPNIPLDCHQEGSFRAVRGAPCKARTTVPIFTKVSKRWQPRSRT